MMKSHVATAAEDDGNEKNLYMVILVDFAGGVRACTFLKRANTVVSPCVHEWTLRGSLLPCPAVVPVPQYLVQPHATKGLPLISNL